MERTRVKKERTNKNKNAAVAADAILTADLHLSESTPVSRTDDYIAAQKKKLSFLRKLSKKNNHCPVLSSGDTFHHWKASPWLCSFAFDNLPSPMITVPGNHDLPEHSLELYEKSALSLLESVKSSRLDIRVLKPGALIIGKLTIIGMPFGELEKFDPEEDADLLFKATHLASKQSDGYNACITPWLERLPGYRRILMLHELTWPGSKPSWASSSYTDEELLERFGEYFDLILTGDNHSYFDSRADDVILVNPGSMLRITADQANYKPRCYLYYADANIVTPVDFPIEENVHSRAHVDKKKEREERIAAYIEKMSGGWELGLSFEKNLHAFFSENSTPKKVREIIWEHFEMKTG